MIHAREAYRIDAGLVHGVPRTVRIQLHWANYGWWARPTS